MSQQQADRGTRKASQPATPSPSEAENPRQLGNSDRGPAQLDEAERNTGGRTDKTAAAPNTQEGLASGDTLSKEQANTPKKRHR